MKRVMSFLLSLILTSAFFFPNVVLAVNDDLDDPEDGLVSQNEAYNDLLTDAPADIPSVTGTSYILYDTESDTILMGKNTDAQIQPAAITKLMTVLLAIENLDLEDTVTVTQPMYIGIPENYYTLGVTEGEIVTVRDLIYAALL
ncbi:MAG: hypothetical protein IKP14_07345, partial [Clostridiales bacterium]|nr:hypothetical protein [Clostridiales bacterium]